MPPKLDARHVQVVGNIRALTTAIQLVQSQNAATETPVRALQGTHRALSKAYNYIAILLTQGSEAEGRAGRQVIAVTGRVKGPHLSVSAIVEVEELPPLSSITLTRNPDQKQDGPSLVKVEEIKRSEKLLKDLADVSRKCVYVLLKPAETHAISSPPDKEVPLAQHAADLFQALIDHSKDRKGTAELFLRFVWLRCHRKIKYRLRTDEVMLGMPLSDILDKWEISPSDEVEEQWFLTGSPVHESLDSFGVPFRLRGPTSDSDREYQFSRDTIPAWCKFINHVLRRTKERAAKCDMSHDSINLVNDDLRTLNLLLYYRQAFETLFCLH
jgi:hypothetical protein